ncbi:MAG: 3-hydroxyacyl-ACP dehydratase FabZ [Bryobacterales bacterium]|nr:3-hydroxyacyl-ACP dehydratase FabZ [Bryobacterales bacterium]
MIGFRSSGPGSPGVGYNFGLARQACHARVRAMLDIGEILKILPHRYPMLLVDRIVEMSGQRIIGIKNVTFNEPFFQGHFPDNPIMPGVLIVEAMAQCGGVLAMGAIEDRERKVVLFTSIDDCRFRVPVTPGDQLRLELDILRRRGPMIKMQGRAYTGERLAAEAVLMCSIADRAAARAR